MGSRAEQVVDVVFLGKVSLCGLCLWWLTEVEAATSTALPPPMALDSGIMQKQMLYLELVINGYATQHTIPVKFELGHYAVAKKDLAKLAMRFMVAGKDVLASVKKASVVEKSLDLSLDDDVGGWLVLADIPDVSVRYDGVKQQLHLSVPAQWLPEQMLGRDYWYQQQPAESSTGALLNYDVYVSMPDQGARVTSIWQELRFFGSLGVLSQTGVYRRYDGATELAAGRRAQYRRYDSVWQYDDEAHATSYRLGDIHSGSKVGWGSNVRMGGLQLVRNFGVRPDMVTYPLPVFAGETAIPSTVDVFVNGMKAGAYEVAPGPFVINAMPFINGKGEAVVVTQDALGRSIQTTMPFYVSGDLLKKGLTDYGLSVGKLRQGYGVQNALYGEWAGVADLRYGLTNGLTLEARAEAVSGLQVYGGGAVAKLAQFGVLKMAYAGSRGELEPKGDESRLGRLRGKEWTLGYQYTQPYFGFGVTHTVRSADYLDLARYGRSDLASVTSQRSTVVHANLSNRYGAFGLGYFDLTQQQQASTRLLSVSWVPVLPEGWRDVTLSLSGSRQLDDKTWVAMVQLSLPLGQRGGYLNSGYEYDQNGAASTYVNYNRPMPTEGGIGVDLAYKRTAKGQAYEQARLSHRNGYANTELGVSHQVGVDKWLGVSGSVVWLNKGLFASNRLGQSFALVDTHGVAGVPVRYENGLVGVTNRSGHLFVPNVAPYYRTKIAIDPLNLPAFYQADSIEQNASIKEGTGLVLDFPVRAIRSANVYLKLPSGEPVPTGAMVTRGTQEPIYVGWDGIAYVADIQAQNELTVALPDGSGCRASFEADVVAEVNAIQVFMKVPCVPEPVKAVMDE